MKNKSLFSIKLELEDLIGRVVNYETGEYDEDAYQEYLKLDMAKEEKIDSWCYFLKQEKAELKAAKELLDSVKARYDALENAYDKRKERFAQIMAGEKFKSAYNTVYYVSSDPVVSDADFDITKLPAEYLSYGKPRLNSTEIKKAFEEGKTIDGVHQEHKESIVIR